MEVGKMADYFVGFDLGKSRDYTAIAIVGLNADYLKAWRTRERAYDDLNHTRKDPYADGVDVEVMERELEDKLDAEPDPVYEVRHLERLPLSTPYAEVARRAKKLMHTPPLRGNAELAVDATGVGAAVVEMFAHEGLTFKRVVITGGEKESRDGQSYRVPKRDLVAATQVLLQNRRLKVAPALPEAKTLTDELLNFRYDITPAGNDTYGARQGGEHDDLVLALCLAVWAARKRSSPVDESLASNRGFYTISQKDLLTLDDPW